MATERVGVAFVIAGFFITFGGGVGDGGIRRDMGCWEVHGGDEKKRIWAGGLVWDRTGTWRWLTSASCIVVWRRFDCNTLGRTGLCWRGVQTDGATYYQTGAFG